MSERLKCPFPYFGGKSRVARLVWDRFGDVDNFVEPFCGSAAVLLARPHEPRIETVNDADAYLANFWRATATAPEEVAVWADWPVNEADLHARHRWLVLSHSAAEFRRRVRREPGYFDARVAGWWVWGLCCWIGGGWCTANNDVEDGEGKAFSRGENQTPCKVDSLRGVHGGATKAHEQRRPRGPAPGQVEGTGVIGSLHQKRPRAHSEHGGGAGGSLPGVHAKMPNSDRRGMDAASQPHEQRPSLSSGDGMDAVPLSEQLPCCDSRGVPSTPPRIQLPYIAGLHGDVGRGLCNDGILEKNGRPQLADAYSRGRGVHGNDSAGTCAARLAWLVGWFGRLRDRLRTVRVCCGDWLRVCDSESVTTRLGVTGIFFDPPYSAEAGRDMGLYARESGTVAHDVRRYCLERGGDPMMRLALCGYRGEGHEELEKYGWDRVDWKAQGGYGSRSAKGKANAKRESLWFSPHCLREASLFDLLED